MEKEAVVINGHTDCEIVADIDAIKIVIDNLVDKAIKYSVNPAEITINLGSSAKKFIVEFSDKGIGIPPKEQKMIFNQFHRIYTKDIPSVKGTGLGLYWVKEIIKNHGGRISVTSEGEKKGSTFRIELPNYQTSKKRFLNSLLKNSKRIKQ